MAFPVGEPPFAVGWAGVGCQGERAGIKALGHGLMLSILRYADEVRPAEPYFDQLSAEPAPEAVRLATELVNAQSGEFAPETMPNEFARAVRELVEARAHGRDSESLRNETPSLYSAGVLA